MPSSLAHILQHLPSQLIAKLLQLLQVQTFHICRTINRIQYRLHGWLTKLYPIISKSNTVKYTYINDMQQSYITRFFTTKELHHHSTYQQPQEHHTTETQPDAAVYMEQMLAPIPNQNSNSNKTIQHLHFPHILYK